MKKKILYTLLLLILTPSLVNAATTIDATCEYLSYDSVSKNRSAVNSMSVTCVISTTKFITSHQNIDCDVISENNLSVNVVNWKYDYANIGYIAKDEYKTSKQCPSYAVVVRTARRVDIYFAKNDEDILKIEKEQFGYDKIYRFKYGAINDISVAEAKIENFIVILNDYKGNSLANSACEKLGNSECKELLQNIKNEINSWNEFITSSGISESNATVKKYRALVKEVETMMTSIEDNIKKNTITGSEMNLNNQIEIDTTENCDILGPRLTKFLNMVFSFIRFAVPILLLGLTIVDAVSALASQDAADVKKISSKFIKRLVISIIIFLLPTILNFILDLAGINCGTGGID